MVHFVYLPGRQAVPREVSLVSIPRAVVSPCLILAIREGPLLLWMDIGSPNQGITPLKRDLQTSIAVSDQVGKVSPHPVKVCTNTRRYLYSDLEGI